MYLHTKFHASTPKCKLLLKIGSQQLYYYHVAVIAAYSRPHFLQPVHWVCVNDDTSALCVTLGGQLLNCVCDYTNLHGQTEASDSVDATIFATVSSSSALLDSPSRLVFCDWSICLVNAIWLAVGFDEHYAFVVSWLPGPTVLFCS